MKETEGIKERKKTYVYTNTQNAENIFKVYLLSTKYIYASNRLIQRPVNNNPRPLNSLISGCVSMSTFPVAFSGMFSLLADG